MSRFFDVHVFYDRKNGFSVAVKIEDDTVGCDDESVIEFAVANKLLDSEDASAVDYVEEIDENEFISMGGQVTN